jgi:hypothetical protein
MITIMETILVNSINSALLMSDPKISVSKTTTTNMNLAKESKAANYPPFMADLVVFFFLYTSLAIEILKIITIKHVPTWANPRALKKKRKLPGQIIVINEPVNDEILKKLDL